MEFVKHTITTTPRRIVGLSHVVHKAQNQGPVAVWVRRQHESKRPEQGDAAFRYEPAEKFDVTVHQDSVWVWTEQDSAELIVELSLIGPIADAVGAAPHVRVVDASIKPGITIAHGDGKAVLREQKEGERWLLDVVFPHSSMERRPPTILSPRLEISDRARWQNQDVVPADGLGGSFMELFGDEVVFHFAHGKK